MDLEHELPPILDSDFLINKFNKVNGGIIFATLNILDK